MEVPDLELREGGEAWSILGLALPVCLPFAILLFTQNKGGGAPTLARSATGSQLVKLTFRPLAFLKYK